MPPSQIKTYPLDLNFVENTWDNDLQAKSNPTLLLFDLDNFVYNGPFGIQRFTLAIHMQYKIQQSSRWT